jgi:hypothetical protein
LGTSGSRARIGIIRPRSDTSLRFETDALISGLRRYDVDVEAIDLRGTVDAALETLNARRCDITYAVAGASILDDDRDGARSGELLRRVEVPLLLRMADPPYMKRYWSAWRGLGERAAISGRDLHLSDYLSACGVSRDRVHYATGRYCATALRAAAPQPHRSAGGAGDPGRPLRARDIPFLLVASLEDPARYVTTVRRRFPRHVDLFLALSDALTTETREPAWRVAQTRFAEGPDGLTPYDGPGRSLLQAASCHADARRRHRIASRLSRLQGVMVLGGWSFQDSPAAAVRTTILPRRSFADVLALMLRSRVVVTIPPRLSTGTVGERSYWAMASGALTVAEQTPALDRHFVADEHYARCGPDMEGMEATIAEASRHPDAAQPIVEAARRHVATEFASVPNVKSLFAPLLDLGRPMAS